jgi:hypothetical protein
MQTDVLGTQHRHPIKVILRQTATLDTNQDTKLQTITAVDSVPNFIKTAQKQMLA